jgi:hypothetical protein
MAYGHFSDITSSPAGKKRGFCPLRPRTGHFVVSTETTRIFAGVRAVLIEQTRHPAVRSRLFENAAAGGVAIGSSVWLQPPGRRGEPVGILELSREVGAIGEAGLNGNLSD